MRFGKRFGDQRGEPAERDGQAEPGTGETGDLALEQALKDFRMSVCAWSEAAYNRPRTAARVVRQRSWRLAAGWALGLALAAGGVSGAVFERHQMARAAEQQRLVQERQRLIREQQAREEEEDLLAKVDRDVSREVPSAMEPLAQLMAEDERK